MKGASAFLAGIAVGALAVVMYRRAEELMEEESGSELAERLDAYLGELESRLKEPKKPKPGTSRAPRTRAQPKARKTGQ